MIDLHYRPTPNGQKIAIDLEETSIPYKIVRVNLCNNDQFGTDSFKISPNNKIPAIVDHDPQDGGRREPRTLHQNRCSSGPQSGPHGGLVTFVESYSPVDK